MPWGLLLSRPDLLAFDFRRHLGISLGTALRTMTWLDFAAQVAGLLSLEQIVTLWSGGRPITRTVPDTVTGAHFHRDDDEETDDG